MIDLCIDARMALCSGIGTCIRQLIPYLNQPPFRLILLVHQKDQFWCRDIEQIHFDAKIYSINEQRLFPLKIPNCDIFWSPHYNVPLLPIRAKKRTVTIHDACHLALEHNFSWLEKSYAKFMMSRALHHSDAVVTDSLFSKNELIKLLGNPKKKILVNHIGVNHKQFQRITDPSAHECLRKTYQLPERFVLFVGNRKPHKNLSGLLNAFSEITDPHLGLVIVGKSKELRHSCQTAKQKNVFFIDFVPDEDLSGLYSLAELLILPSFYEGFGLPPLEAMSCGCPTIVSNTASLPEVCGNASYFINPENPRDIREGILKVSFDRELKSQLISRGYERVKLYDWARCAQLYRSLFELLLRTTKMNKI